MFLLFLTSAFTTVFAQTNGAKINSKKCKPTFDTEIGRDNYEPEILPVFADKNLNDSIFLTEPFKFKVSPKHHTDEEWVKFAYMIEKDGKSTFLKLLSPENDKEIEDEAKRIVSIMPLYKPAMCGQEAVPTRMNIRFPMRTN